MFQLGLLRGDESACSLHLGHLGSFLHDCLLSCTEMVVYQVVSVLNLLEKGCVELDNAPFTALYKALDSS